MSYNVEISPRYTNSDTERYWQYRGVGTKEYYLVINPVPEPLAHHILTEDGKYLSDEIGILNSEDAKVIISEDSARIIMDNCPLLITDYI